MTALVDDGKVALAVDAVEGDDVVCTIVGPVSDNKGISSCPNERDRAGPVGEGHRGSHVRNLGVDMVASSSAPRPMSNWST